MLAQLTREGLAAAGLPEDAVQLVEDTDRGLVGAMLAAVGGIDVIIPRGGRSLVERVQNEARVPVFAHLEGICHLYVDAAADPDKAEALVVNAKMRRVEIWVLPKPCSLTGPLPQACCAACRCADQCRMPPCCR